MKDSKQKRRRRIQYREVHHAYQMTYEIEELRWQIDNLLEVGMINSDDHILAIVQIDKIDENVKAMLVVIDSLREALRWPSR